MLYEYTRNCILFYILHCTYAKERTRRIVGGKEAKFENWRFIAAVLHHPDTINEYIKGVGAFVSVTCVLTNAVAVTSQNDDADDDDDDGNKNWHKLNKSELAIGYGSANVHRLSKKGIKDIILSKDFNYNTVSNAITIILLESPVKLSKVSLATMGTQRASSLSGMECKTAAWSSIPRNNPEFYTNRLMEIKQIVVNDKYCEEDGVDLDKFCTNGAFVGMFYGTCDLDQGAPLMCDGSLYGLANTVYCAKLNSPFPTWDDVAGAKSFIKHIIGSGYHEIRSTNTTEERNATEFTMISKYIVILLYLIVTLL